MIATSSLRVIDEQDQQGKIFGQIAPRISDEAEEYCGAKPVNGRNF